MTNKKPIFAAKYFSYIIFIILLFVLQTTPGFLTVLEIKPNFVIPAAVCIAMRDVETERHIFRILQKHPLPESERFNWVLDQYINNTGVALDMILN